ncbi:nicotinate-nucleotide--dimethylbenzimidazole phosphoribosyltransferase [Streptomyces celluloflavus]|uniref:nicotinate-nucleotide--dimethylbenzimidazole phosphoribosyltransferase n=1 Tax=Streptomyces celluloflavus TaxID=58344 RepID=UPI003652719B
MTDTGQVPGEGLPENAGGHPGQPQPAAVPSPVDTGTTEQPGIVPAPAAYPYLDPVDGVPEDDDLLLMPSAQGAWSEQPAPQPQQHGNPQVQARQPQQNAPYATAAAGSPVPAHTGDHESGGRDSGAVDLGAVRSPQGRTPAAPARRPLHMGPPVPETTGGVVRSLADRGPAAAPQPPAGPPAGAPEYLDVPDATPATTMGEQPIGGPPPVAQAYPEQSFGEPSPAAQPFGVPSYDQSSYSEQMYGAPGQGPLPGPQLGEIPSRMPPWNEASAQAVAAPVAETADHAAAAPAGEAAAGTGAAAQAAPQAAEAPRQAPVPTPDEDAGEATDGEAAGPAADAAPGEPDGTAATGAPQDEDAVLTAAPAAEPAPRTMAQQEQEQEQEQAGPQDMAATGQEVSETAAAETAVPEASAPEASVHEASAQDAPVPDAVALHPQSPAAAEAPQQTVDPDQAARTAQDVQPAQAEVPGPPAGTPSAPDGAAGEPADRPAPEAEQPEPAAPVADAAAYPAADAHPGADAHPDTDRAAQSAPAAQNTQAPQGPRLVVPAQPADPALPAPAGPEAAADGTPLAGPVASADESQPAAAQADAPTPAAAPTLPAPPAEPDVAPVATAAATVPPEVVAPQSQVAEPAADEGTSPEQAGIERPEARQPVAGPPQSGASTETADAPAAAPGAAPADPAQHQDQDTPAGQPQPVPAGPHDPGATAAQAAPADAAPEPVPAAEPVAEAEAEAEAEAVTGSATVAEPVTEAGAAPLPADAEPVETAEPGTVEPPADTPSAAVRIPAQAAGGTTAAPAAPPVGAAAADTPPRQRDAAEPENRDDDRSTVADQAHPEAVTADSGPAAAPTDAAGVPVRAVLPTQPQPQDGAPVDNVMDTSGAPIPIPAPAAGYDDSERAAVHRVMRERRDIRNGFRGDPIPNEVLLRVLEAAHTAPSVGHSQPWDFVVIRSDETREKMHRLAMEQRDAYAASLPKARAKQFRELKIEAILETPVNIVVTADSTRGGRHTLGRHTQPQMAPYSSALAVENLWLAARAEGLGVGWVSFFDEREMVQALGLPDHLEVVAYLCIGYVDEFPDEPELMQAGWSKRRPLSWVVHEETYGRRALPGEDPHDLLQETLQGIRPLDAKALGEAWERQKRMTKPAGALGMLEIISAQLSGLSRKCPPPIPEPAAVAIFAGDHGVHAQGVTPWPQEVTGQMVANFLGGGAVCNAFAHQVGAEVCVVDVGVAGELPATPGLLPRKVRPGTDDFTTGPAMSQEDVLKAIEVGIETARDLVAAGNKALLTGEMGIANTTTSAALISVYTDADPVEVTGRGTGINDETHARKVDVVRRALELHQPDPNDPIGVLAAVGGLEHAALVGLILGGASLRTPVILDGVSAGAAALVARAIAPEALAACIAGHRSAEPGHVAALTKLGLRPLVDLDLRLGEGTGALLALPVVQSAARAMHEVATFDSAGVTEKS